ncbi:MAG TPA: hypothetical protein VN753_17895 [Terracidiphilus sp.]|jgi:pilus assembly protein Flp/PilA|nr:hypothetical protein [Terracidiphilus sp.]
MNPLQALTCFACNLLVREGGQDLVEYSLIFAMIALGSVTGMGYLASGINDVFSTVGSTLTTSV